jgi:hypothetical protein
MFSAVAARRGAGAQQAQVGAAVRLGQAHGAGPAAIDQRPQEHPLLPVVAVVQQRFGGAVREQREVAPGQVGGVDHFLDGHAEGVRQALAAELRGRVEPRPAGLDVLRVGPDEAGGRGDRAGVPVEAAAFAVADRVERGQHRLGEARAFLQHRVDHVRGRLVESQAREQGRRVEQFVQDEADVVQWRLVYAHAAPCTVSASRRGARARG